MKKEIVKRLKVAEIIQNARLQKGITQGELADKVGFSRSTIIRIEQGKFSPNADQLYDLMSVLDLEIKIDGKII